MIKKKKRGGFLLDVQKFNKSEVGHMLTHYERGCSHYSNDNIDSTRTNMNYNLAPDRGISQSDYLKKMLDNIYHSNKKDLILLADWSITAPKDLDSSSYKDFFQLSYEFCCNRYGHIAGFDNPEDICISAYVHMDEMTPHMHFAFCPIKKYEDGSQKFRCKDVICRADLKSFHKELEYYLNKNGVRCKLLNGNTIRDKYGRALPTEEYKRIVELVRERELNRDRDRREGRF